MVCIYVRRFKRGSCTYANVVVSKDLLELWRKKCSDEIDGSDKAETLKRRNLHDNFSSRIPRFVIESSHPVAACRKETKVYNVPLIDDLERCASRETCSVTAEVSDDLER